MRWKLIFSEFLNPPDGTARLVENIELVTMCNFVDIDRKEFSSYIEDGVPTFRVDG